MCLLCAAFFSVSGQQSRRYAGSGRNALLHLTAVAVGFHDIKLLLEYSGTDVRLIHAARLGFQIVIISILCTLTGQTVGHNGVDLVLCKRAGFLLCGSSAVVSVIPCFAAMSSILAVLIFILFHLSFSNIGY